LENCAAVAAHGSKYTISKSKIKKRIATKKNWILKNWKSWPKGSTPHSYAEIFSCFITLYDKKNGMLAKTNENIKIPKKYTKAKL
jgi:hypothetical protein